MEDGIPLIFQQLPATTGFVQSPGEFFLKAFSCHGQNRMGGWGSGNWKKEKERIRRRKREGSTALL